MGDARCSQVGGLGGWLCSHTVNLKYSKILSHLLNFQAAMETKHFSKVVLQFWYNFELSSQKCFHQAD